MLQKSDLPFDWCFIGAPEDNVHTPHERVHKSDLAAMIELYRVLMEKL
jgi:putative aminopeptidase FrvX